MAWKRDHREIHISVVEMNLLEYNRRSEIYRVGECAKNQLLSHSANETLTFLTPSISVYHSEGAQCEGVFASECGPCDGGVGALSSGQFIRIPVN